MTKYKLTSNKKGRRIFAEDYGKMKYRSLRYITPKGYRIKKINKKDQVIEYIKIKEKD
jgi:hypothetical protein